VTATGTLTYGASITARNIATSPASDAHVALEAGDLKVLRFKVTDGYGNGVPGVTVSFNNAGAGFFFGGTNSATSVTGTDGIASVTVTSLPSSFGAANVTATILPSAGIFMTCDPTSYPVNSPVVGFKAGNCTTTAVVQIGMRPTVNASNTRTGAGSVSIHGVTNAGASVALLQWSGTKYVQVATTTASSTGAYNFTRTITMTTAYRVQSPTTTGLQSVTHVAYVRYGVSLSLTSATKGHVTAKTTVNPKVGNVEVRFYKLSGGKYTYLGHAFTGSTGVASKTFSATSGKSVTIVTRALATSHRLKSGLTSKSIVVK